MDRKAAPADKPLMVIARTVKGKGVSFMENRSEWHGVAPSPQELEEALGDLENGAKEGAC